MLVNGIFHTVFGKIIPLTQALIGFSALIIVHECGHFLFAKLFGIRAPTFSIGMGPTVYKRQIGETQFQIAAFPVGGYVEVELERSDDNKDNSNTKDPRKGTPYWQKLIVMLAGVFFNLLLAWFIFSGAFWHGMPTIRINEITISEVIKDSAAEKAGLKDGDRIVGFGKRNFSDFERMDFNALRENMSGKPGDSVSLLLERDKDKFSKKITLGSHPDKNGRGILGIMFGPSKYSQVAGKPQSILNALKSGLKMTAEQMVKLYGAIKMMFTQRSMAGVGGPVMIMSQGLKVAQHGLLSFLLFLAFVSVGLAFTNLLPLGVLDGGRILFITLEAIFRRNLPDIVHIVVNVVSLITLAGLMLMLTYRDIVSLFTK